MTKSELVSAVLRRLRVLAAGETADANDADLVGEVYDSEYQQLKLLGLVPFDSNAVASWAERPLVRYIAAEVGPEFGHSNEMENQAKKDRALRDLRTQMARQRSRPLPTKAEYF